MTRYDMLVIGSGPAGQRAAIQAAKLGKKVAVIERQSRVGGVSLYTGTIPSKTLREAVLYLSGWDQRGLYGNNYRLKKELTLSDLMDRVEITLQHQAEIIQNQLRRNHIEVIEGGATFIDAHRLQVVSPTGDFTEYSADKIVIAVGSHPHRPKGIRFEEEAIMDSDEILDMQRLPKSLIVVGSGVIGVEYASIFSAMDIEVTVVDGRATLLDFLDREMVDSLVQSMNQQGVTFLMEEKVAHVECAVKNQTTITLQSGKTLCADMVLFAAGRVGSTGNLRVQNAGLEPDKRQRLTVNECYQTAASHIYAVGDVIGFPSLASTSMEQGRLAACHAFGMATNTMPDYFPFGIYSVPEISYTGKTEKELIEQEIPYEIGVAPLRETARGQIMGLQDGKLKMLFSLENRRLLGVHIIGEEATELIHIGQAVMILGGTLDYFLENVFNYPTLAEAYKTAALDAWNRFAC